MAAMPANPSLWASLRAKTSRRTDGGAKKAVAGDGLPEQDRCEAPRYAAAAPSSASVACRAPNPVPPSGDAPADRDPHAPSTERTTAVDDAHTDPASRLWDRAYDGLKTDEPALVVEYEKILSSQLQRGLGAEVPDAQPNTIAQHDPVTRRRQMTQLIDAGLGKTAREAKAKERMGTAADVVLGARDVVSSAIEALPQASLAWTGVCVALQVRRPGMRPFPAEARRCLPIRSRRPKRTATASSTWQSR